MNGIAVDRALFRGTRMVRTAHASLS